MSGRAVVELHRARLLALLWMAGLLSGCGVGQREASAPLPRDGIVSLSLTADEVLLALGLEERIAALSPLAADARFSCAAAAASALGRAVPARAEPILALQPSLVITSAFTTAETRHQLRAAAVPLLELAAPTSLEEIEDQIIQIAQAAGAGPAGVELRDALRARVRAAGQSATALEGLRVVGVMSESVLGRGTIFDAAAMALGWINVASEQDLDGWPRLSAEALASWEVDRIFYAAYPGQEEAVLEQLLRNPALAARYGDGDAVFSPVPNAVFVSTSHHVAALLEQLVALAAGMPTAPGCGGRVTGGGPAARFP